MSESRGLFEHKTPMVSFCLVPFVQNGQNCCQRMLNWQNDKLKRWQVVVATKCQGEEMSSEQIIKLTECQVGKVLSWQTDH